MPLVLVYRNPKKINDDVAKILTRALPEIVASALTVPHSDGYLTKGDIEVRVIDIGSLDVSTKDIEIIIFAGDYPERKANLDKRREDIIADIKLLNHKVRIPPSGIISGFVWVILSPNSFGEFVTTFLR